MPPFPIHSKHIYIIYLVVGIPRIIANDAQ